MGAFSALREMLKINGMLDKRTEKIIEEEIKKAEREGNKDSDEIAERLAPKEKSFVPKVDVSPVEMPEKNEKAEKGKEEERV